MNQDNGVCRRALAVMVAVIATGATLIAAPAAQAATLCVNPGGTGGCFSTIEGAVDAAASGDIITVAAGTYTEPDGQLLIDKGVTIQGAGAQLSILDGQSAPALPTAGTVRVDTPDDVTVSDLGVVGAGTAGGTRAAIGLKGSASGQDFLFEDIRVQGSGSTSGNDYGIWADHSGANLTIRSSTILDTDFNPVLVERPLSGVDLDGNTITPLSSGSGSAAFVMSYAGDNVSAPVRIRNNTVSTTGMSVTGNFLNDAGAGTFSDVQITDNTVTGLAAGSAISLSNNDTDAGGANGIINAALVSGNVLAGTNVAGTRGVTVTGVVTGAQVFSNSISGFDHGVRVVDNAGGTPTGLIVRFNRIADNTVGIQVNGTANLDAQNNWWGCNAGPANVACDSVAGTGVVDSDPYLKLAVTAGSTSLGLGDSTTLTASVRGNSDGTELTGPFWRGSSVAFATDRGSVSPPSAPLSPTNGTAATTLSAGAVAGSGNASATLDSATAQAAFTVNGPPDTTPPVISDLRLVPRRFVAGSTPTPVLGRKKGSSIRFTITEKATVSFRVVKFIPKKPGLPDFWKPRTFHRDVLEGDNAVRFTGTLRKHTFQPGRYKLVVLGVDAAGNTSTKVVARFRIVGAG